MQNAKCKMQNDFIVPVMFLEYLHNTILRFVYVYVYSTFCIHKIKIQHHIWCICLDK